MPHGEGNSLLVSPPGELIREELRRRGWTQRDLAIVLDQPISRINQIIQGKQSLTPEVAVSLAAAFGISARDWITREFSYRCSLTLLEIDRLQEDFDARKSSELQKRRQLFETAPVKELQKRGWIRPTDDPSAIEKDLAALLEVSSLDEKSPIRADMRKSGAEIELSSSQRAWCCRVRQIAKSLLVNEYKPERMENCKRELRRIAAYSQEVRKVPTILAGFGIKFVIVEPLAACKIDGMATWIGESPVIGLSLRYDRIDNFWHTLCHELSHIMHRDAFSADVFEVSDSDLAENMETVGTSELERRADSEAAGALIPPEELNSFIRRVSPLYSKDRINQFANKIKIHPGIIVGQLQRKGELGWSACRDMLVKVRHSITPVAVTDGWGMFIDTRRLQ